MKNIIEKIITILCCSAVLVLTGCSKTIEDEISSITTSRVFSPTKLTAIVVNKTGVRLNWTGVSKAESYTIEFFANGTMDFSGTPVRTIEGVVGDELPYTVSGLDGETDYSVRVKAIGAGMDDSKWSGLTFTTEAEQIFLALNPTDLEATRVTLRWPAGETATQVVLQPGSVTHSITAGEIANGAVTLTGLAAETNYTATLLNGTKTRGTITFTTLTDLGGAIQVNPEDDLSATIAAANAGDVFALMPGEYTTQDIPITKSISIKGARPSNKPILKGAIFRIVDGAGLELKDLVIDGTGSLDGNQMIIYDADMTSPYAPLKVENCTIRNYTKGVMYVNKRAQIQSVLFQGNIIHSIECSGGDFIDFRAGIATTFNFLNNTVYNSALARDLFRMDAGGSTNFPGINSIITISNNTFYNVSNGSNRRFLYIRLASHSISFNKNIIAATDGYYTNQSSTTITTMSKNNYHNAPNFTGSTVSGAKNDSGDFTSLNPGFTDPAAGDFSVGNIELKASGIGDPRWLN